MDEDVIDLRGPAFACLFTRRRWSDRRSLSNFAPSLPMRSPISSRDDGTLEENMVDRSG